MKYIMTMIAAIVLAACSGSSEASKTEVFQMDVAANLPELLGNNVWKMNEAESTLTFTAVHNSREFTGEFSNFAAAIKLDPASPADGEIHVAVDLSSVDAGDRDRNANLPGKDWFNIASFPVATFTSRDITLVSGDNFKAAGELSLKGVTAPITLVFSLRGAGDTAIAIGGTELIRTDFNVGEGPDFSVEDWVKFPVQVKFEINAAR